MPVEITQQVDGEFSATLLAMAGHDLRQPLQLITSAHDLLGGMLREKGQREELARAEYAAKRLAAMLSQLVDAVHLESSRDHPLGPVALAPILDELAAEFAEPAGNRGITVRVAAAGAIALSHPVLLTGMLRNLIRNAIDYTPPGGRVLVAARRRGSELHIQVRDNGNGIRDATLPGIFEAFHRDGGTRTAGLGLGLFIVERAADLLGHRVEVRSTEGRGSCFTVVTGGVLRVANSFHSPQRRNAHLRERKAENSHDQFGREIEQHIPRLRRYARAMTRDRVGADDLVQSCLTRALGKQHLWRAGTDMRAWLFTILHHLHVSDIRRSAREQANAGADLGFMASAPYDPGDRLELRDLDRAIGRLPEEQRRVLLLIGLEGIAYEEAAAILAVPIGTIRSRLARARKSLREQLYRPKPAKTRSTETALLTPRDRHAANNRAGA